MLRLAQIAFLFVLASVTFAAPGSDSQQPDSQPAMSLLLVAPTVAGEDRPRAWQTAVQALPHDGVLVFPNQIVDGYDGAGVSLKPGESGSVGPIEVIRIPDNGGVGEDILARVSRALDDAGGEHLMLAFEHAAWAAGDGSDWSEIHETIVADGRVFASCAVGEGLLRDDGEKDGVRYFGLPFADRAAPDGLNHFGGPAIVQVVLTENSIELARIDPAGVRPQDASQGARLDGVLSVRDGLSVEGSLESPLEGGTAGTVEVTLMNPTDHELGFSLALRAPSGWSFTPRRLEGTIPPGESFRGSIAAVAPEIDAKPQIRAEGVVRVPLGDDRVQGVRVSAIVPFSPTLSDQPGSQNAQGGVLKLNARSGISLDLSRLEPAYTIEAWVNAAGEQSDGVLWSTEGVLVRWIGPESEEPFPTAVLLDSNGNQRTLTSPEPGVREAWTHLALCVTDEHAILFVDGQPAAEVAGDFSAIEPGAFTIGGVIGPYNSLVSGFRGSVDGVRVSSTARYAAPFTPERKFELDEATAALLQFEQDHAPAYRNESPRSEHAWSVGQ